MIRSGRNAGTNATISGSFGTGSLFCGVEWVFVLRFLLPTICTEHTHDLFLLFRLLGEILASNRIGDTGVKMILENDVLDVAYRRDYGRSLVQYV